ncbi:MAG TPA: glycoside hydrolase family 16 protein, partial [Blastocatellia bacterium]|nr:glycoside hydrolase family 16 protein [Blastocatellia bacterium]
ARVILKGRFVEPAQNRVLQFSGYEWEVRSLQSDRGGGINFFSPEHAWVDEQGRLHLRIAREHGRWVCAEVMSRKSFGYGTYQFVVQNAAKLDPRMVVTLFTWHYTNSEFNHREIDVELSRWGDPGQKNSQYVIQPYYVPENIAKFESPPGPVTYSFRWEPDQVTFRSVRGDGTGPAGGSPIFQHTFTSEIPPAGGERVGMNFYLFEAAPPMSGAGAELIIENFIFLP